MFIYLWFFCFFLLVTCRSYAAVCAGLFKALNTFSCTFMRQNPCIFLVCTQCFCDPGLLLLLTFQSKLYPIPHDIIITISTLSYCTNEFYPLVKFGSTSIVFIAAITNTQKRHCKCWLDEVWKILLQIQIYFCSPNFPVLVNCEKFLWHE